MTGKQEDPEAVERTVLGRREPEATAILVVVEARHGTMQCTRPADIFHAIDQGVVVCEE